MKCTAHRRLAPPARFTAADIADGAVRVSRALAKSDALNRFFMRSIADAEVSRNMIAEVKLRVEDVREGYSTLQTAEAALKHISREKSE